MQRGAGVLLVALAACGGDAPPEEPASAEAAPALPSPTVWTLQGRVTPHPSDLPSAPPFEGGRALLEGCEGTEPCAAERWAAPDGRSRVFLWRGDELRQPAGTPWPATWERVDGPLLTCLRHPLFHPPAADPAGRRELVERGDTWTWVLHFTGQNPCRLGGALFLEAQGPGVDTAALEVAGRPWSEGGRKLLDDANRMRRALEADPDEGEPAP